MALSEQEIYVEKHSQNYANWNRPYPANEIITTAYSTSLPISKIRRKGSDSCWTFDGKTHHGKLHLQN
jgi:hypothetical protein